MCTCCATLPLSKYEKILYFFMFIRKDGGERMDNSVMMTLQPNEMRGYYFYAIR